MAASGRKRPVIFEILVAFERPLSGKADVQILALEISLPSDRYTRDSGRSADKLARGRCRPVVDIHVIPIIYQ